MSTLGELIDRIRHYLSGFDSAKDGIAALSSSINTTDLTLALDGAEQSGGRGVAEIDLELLAIRSVDASTGSAVAWPFGRGYRSTTAASHASGAEVRFNPSWPASTIARAINEVIYEVYPLVYSVVIEESEFPSDFGAIELTGDPVGVISVFVADDTITDGWIRDDRWDFNKNRSDSGKTLHVGGRYEPGRVVRVVYAQRPATFDLSGSLSQSFTTVTGLEARHEDLLLLGVAYRLAPFVDLARLPQMAAEARADVEQRGSLSGASHARLLYSMYQTRLEQESLVLAKENPIRLHKVR